MKMNGLVIDLESRNRKMRTTAAEPNQRSTFPIELDVEMSKVVPRAHCFLKTCK